MGGAEFPADASSVGRFRLPKSRLIRRGSEIVRTRRKGRRVTGHHVEVFLVSSPALHPRVGIVVPKWGHNSVQRNQLKRRIREICRVDVLPLLESREKGIDVLVRARVSAYTADFGALREELGRILGHLV